MYPIAKGNLAPARIKYEWRYLSGRTPWEDGVSPRQVLEFAENATPGRAIDLGCGAGTNAMTLARKGWQVTGVDFSFAAVWISRRRAARAGLSIDFQTGDILNLKTPPTPHDYALDIGCLFSLAKHDRGRYADTLRRLVGPGGLFMLFAWLPLPGGGKGKGISPEETEGLMDRSFRMVRSTVGREKERLCAWYWFRRRENTDRGRLTR